MPKKVRFPNLGKSKKDEFIGLLSGATENIVIPDGIDGVDVALVPSFFANNKLIKGIDFNNCTVVPRSYCDYCNYLSEINLPKVTTVESQAFYNIGCGISDPLKRPSLKVDHRITVQTEGFNEARLGEIDALLGNVDRRGFYRIKWSSSTPNECKKFHVNIYGTLGDDAFANFYGVEDFYFDPESRIFGWTDGGARAFAAMGHSRPNKDTQFIWDLRNSSFYTIPAHAWSMNRNSLFALPESLVQIGDHALDVYSGVSVYLTSLPDLLASYIFSAKPTIVLNYELDEEELKVKTNWATYADYVFPGLYDYVGALPKYTRKTGLPVSWYSDKEKTNPIESCDTPNTIVYAEKGDVREVYHITRGELEANISVFDGEDLLQEFAPVGATLTISASPINADKAILYRLLVNGVDYTEAGSATVSANQDIHIVAIFWDGVTEPFAPTLSDNSFEQIKLASKLGYVPDTWQPGDEIFVTYDGDRYPCRLVDRTGKYRRLSDDSVAYFCFEFENVLPERYDTRNYGKVDNKITRLLNSGEIYDKIDKNLRDCVEDVKVLVASIGTVATPSNIPYKFFLPREADITATRVMSSQLEFDAIEIDEYYSSRDTNEARRKATLASPTEYKQYQLLSPRVPYEVGQMVVESSGQVYATSASSASAATYLRSVAIRFVL